LRTGSGDCEGLNFSDEKVLITLKMNSRSC